MRFRPALALVVAASVGILFACNQILGIDPDSLHAREPPPPGDISIAPATLSFGGIACGKQAAPQQITITNTTADTVTWSAILSAGPSSAFTISPSSGSISPNGQATLAVSANPVPTNAGLVSLRDSLVITTSSLDAGATIGLAAGAQGAIVVVDRSSLAFPKTPPGNISDASIMLTNHGDITATIALDAGTELYFSPATVTLAPDASISVGVAFAPTRFGSSDVTLQLSAAETSCAASPQLALTGTSVGSVAELRVGGTYACALLKSGGLVCWGYHPSSLLMLPTTVPTLVGGFPAGERLTQITAGNFHMCALSASGTVYCWGDNSYGELGNGVNLEAGAPPYQAAPVQVKNISDVVSVAAGGSTTCAVVHHPDAGADEVWCWGSGENGELANGQNGVGVESSSPVRVAHDDDGGAFPALPVLDLAVGGFNACVILGDHKAHCWGSGYQGANGDNSGAGGRFPGLVTVGGANIMAIATGANFYASCTVTTTNDLYCWGDNRNGAVGNGTIDEAGATGVPGGYKVPGAILQALQVISGYQDFCARDTTGWVSCWGNNALGQTGFDPAISENTLAPTSVPHVGDGNLVDVRAGLGMTCALRLTGEVLCWGSNNFGELGAGFSNPNDAGSGYTLAPQTVPGFQ